MNAILEKKPQPILHERCGRKHSKQELVDKCEARLDAKAADAERRLANAEAVTVEEYVRIRHVEGMSYDKIAAALKKDYPPPPAHLLRPWVAVQRKDHFDFVRDESWSVGNVIELDSQRFWPGII